MIKAVMKSDPKFLNTIEIDNHIQILDEPVSLGGNNQGPTPIQSVYAALAGCINMTLRMYADSKKIPLERVEVKIKASKETVADDDERFQNNPAMIDKGKVRFIHADIQLHGDINEEQIDKLHIIAGKCPVHKMLMHGSCITHDTRHENREAVHM